MVDIKKNKFILIIILTTICIGALIYTTTKKEVEEIPYTLFKTFLSQGIVSEVYLDGSPKIKILLGNGNEIITDNPRTIDFKEYLLMNDVKVIEDSQSVENISFALLILSSLAFLFFYQRKNFTTQAEKEMANISKMDNDEFDIKIGFRDFLKVSQIDNITPIDLEPKERIQKIVSTVQEEVQSSKFDNLGIVLDLVVNMDRYKKLFSTFNSIKGKKGNLNDTDSIINLIDVLMDSSNEKDKEKVKDMSKMLDIIKLLDMPKAEKPNDA